MNTLITPKINDIKNKTVLVRVDFNVPINDRGVVTDTERIQNALETILFLREHQAKIILISHLGRPEGRKNPNFSLEGVAFYLRNNLRLPTYFAHDCLGSEVKKLSQKLLPGELLLLENLRFYSQEESGDRKFAKQLVTDTGAEVFINEAFSASHRAHASIVNLPALLPHFSGFALAAELRMLRKTLEKSPKPFVVVMGGAKIDDKVQAVENLTRLADLVLVGGGVANAFLKASQIEVHQSFMGKDAVKNIKLAQKILAAHQDERTIVKNYQDQHGLPLSKIVMPIDVVAAKNAQEKDKSKLQKMELLKNVKDSEQDLPLQYLDIGPKTVALYKYLLSTARTIFWNGPMGVFENPLFAGGSLEIAKTIAHLTTENNTTTICGGGETNALINSCGLRGRYSYVSTAGGAALEFIGGAKLPGIEALMS